MVTTAPRQQKETIVKVIVKRNVMIGGKPYGPGDKVELPDNEAKYLINVGKVALEAAPKAKETADSKAAQERETTAKG